MIKVNNQELSKNEFQGACYNYMAHTGRQELSKEDKLVVANQLVDTNLLLAEAKKSGYKPEEAEIEENFTRLVSQFPSREQFDKTLEEMGDSIETVKERLSDDIILKAFIEGEFYSKISISDDDVSKFYTENEQMFVTQDQVKASHILMKDEDAIKDVKSKIDSGASFEDLAKEHSECPSGQNGGDLGFFGKGKMVPEFETAAFALGVEEISDPFKTDFGFHIVKVTGKSEAGKQSLEDVSDGVKRHLEQLQANQVISAKVKELRESADIEIDAEAL